MNHRTRLDWMWIWPVLYHYAQLRKLKIVLKSPLKWAPGFGWAMQQAGFMFLNRHWQDDRDNMDHLVDYYNTLNHPMELLIFPEGTDFCKKAIESSDKFAEKNNKPKYNFVLHPRKTGFQFLAQKFIENEQIECIQDITVGYPRNLVTDETCMIMNGEFPEEVHFHLEKFNINKLPSDWDGLGDWIDARWSLKEQKLRKYYSERECEKRQFDAVDQDEFCQHRRGGMYFAMIFWPCILVLWAYCLKNPWFWCYQIAIFSFYAIQPWWFGGLEVLVAVISKLFKPKQSTEANSNKKYQ